MAETNLDVARRIVESVDRRDRAAVFACLAPDVEWHTLGRLLDQGSVLQGREHVWGYIGALADRFDDLHIAIEEIEAVGDVVVSRSHLRATEPATGEAVETHFSTLAVFRDQKIVRADNYEDHDEALTDAELRRTT